MPAQKRLHEASQEDEEALRANDVNDVEQAEDEVESDRSNTSSNCDKEEYVVIKLSDIRKEVQCPICLGIIRKTRTVMECLHRFCRACIDKSMRLGNNECPTCRTHCASRRSLRDDPNYDTLIAALYPDIDKYEEEELALHEDEVTHNKQIQASIAETLRRQTEALGKRRNAKATAVAFVRRSQGNFRTAHLRRRRNFRIARELHVSNDIEDMNDDGRNGSSSDDIADEENSLEVDREIISSWGKNGHRSNTRVNGGKSSRSSRISRLVDSFRSSEEEEDDKLDVFLVVVSLDEQRIPSLEEPYLQCRPTLSVGKLIKYVALKTALQDDEVELCLVDEPGELQVGILRGERTVDPDKDTLRVLEEQEKLAELKRSNLVDGYLLVAYKRKSQNSSTVVKAEW